MKNFGVMYMDSLKATPASDVKVVSVRQDPENFQNSLISRTFSHNLLYQDSLKRTFSTFKDPGSKPLCDKGACFEKNFYDLPENRLKLVVSQKVLKNDEDALKRISYKLSQEEQAEFSRQQKNLEARAQILASKENRKKRMDDLQAKTGLIKLNMRKTNSWTVNSRINSLAQPKNIKRGLAEDYIDSYGLLKAGVLETGNTANPKSARIPSNKISTPFPGLVNNTKIVAWEKKDEKKEKEVYSQKEIKECMKDINDFHRRIGKGKGKVGFPQIFLEKYKKSN